VGFGAIEGIITTWPDIAGPLSHCATYQRKRCSSRAERESSGPMTQPRQLPSGPLEGDPPPNLFPAAGGPSVKRNTVNEMIITELSHRRRHGRTSRLVKPRPGDRIDTDGVVVFMAEWSYTKRYVTDALAALPGGKLIALANSDPIVGGTPTALTDAETVPRGAVLGSPGPQTPRFVSHADARALTPAHSAY
jgi:hypothetical protein